MVRWIGLFFVGVLGFGFVAGASIEGIVSDRDGDPARGIDVYLFEVQTESFQDEDALDSATSDEDGQFFLEAPLSGEGILLLKGSEGSGRVRLAGTGTVEVTYPVRNTVIFLHDNDTHWNFTQEEAFRGQVESYRERYEDVFLLSAGDIFIRHQDRWPEPRIADYEARSAEMIEIMNTLRYDAAVLGNHELHYHEHATRRALERAQFPLLAANAIIETDKLPESIRPHVFLETSTRYQVAVIGLSAVPEMEGLRPRGLFETARLQVNQLQNRADLMVGLTHIGYQRDRELARIIPEFDLIVGGHTHTLLMHGHEVNGVLIVQAGGVPPGHPVSDRLPKYLGRVAVTIENGSVIERDPKVYIFQE